jgi:hypothetical protein
MYQFVPQLGSLLVTPFGKSKKGYGCWYKLVHNGTVNQCVRLVLFRLGL